MPAKFENTTNTPNLINVHINALEPGNLIVRLEYVTSQEHIERVRRGEATAESVELLIKPHQARKIAEGLVRQADLIEASKLPSGGSKQ
ncbi:hypothetical protein IG197_12135 [Aminobacter sp. SR38]|jgi:hypothetical protein|uniref:hypothetical protein n=1 Tax=Aminobacter sp. SR38 TaxID=2774562 RepID=UPI00178565CE|nr:hypothetical protein [Aminobacter sp. SR38]QOF73740.1 hypothetical protein IG197_12135 [Aminobacter sp. SR38]